jgi:pimeloyl-ACP methyl ester carboxylesterase
MTAHSLILIPGLMCDATVWAPQVAGLEDLAQIRIPDHGLADSLPAMAESILRQAPQRFAVAGHSMGGRVALELVRRASHRITGLALLDTSYLPRPEGAAGERELQERHKLLELAQREGMRAVGERWLRIPMVHPDRFGDRELLERILGMIEQRRPEQFAAQVRALLARPDATSLLGTIRCPTLVLCGKDDAWALLTAHRTMAALIPGSTLVSIPHCGHMSTLERPQPVNRALRAWLLEVIGGRDESRNRARGAHRFR